VYVVLDILLIGCRKGIVVCLCNMRRYMAGELTNSENDKVPSLLSDTGVQK